MTDDSDILDTAYAWHMAGRQVAVATVVQTWGSAPRGVGSHLVVDSDGAMEGSVSGGCVEGAVVTEALEALQFGHPRLLDYGVSDDDAFAAGLACGGQIKVLVEPVGNAMPVEALLALVTARKSRELAVYQVDTRGGIGRIVAPDNAPIRSGLMSDGHTYVSLYAPNLRLVIIGAVHIAQSLVPMARACSFAPIVIDPRPAFGTSTRFPDTIIVDDWPDAGLVGVGLDARTAVVTLTHDSKLDDPAIMTALQSDAFYVGCLGSTRTHAKRIARLQDAGLAEHAIARIHAPVGLAIGAANPAEIAVSIMAQIITVLRQSN